MSAHNDDVIRRLREHIAGLDPKDLEVIPPLSILAVNAAESELGFALPALLRDVYTQIGSGCFGFQCCLLELTRSRLMLELTRSRLMRIGFTDAPSIAELYQEFKLDSIVPVDDDPLAEWPDQFIPFCSWGCHMYSCIDCSKSPFPVFGYDPSLYEYDQLFLHYPSLSAWMNALLDGSDLWAKMNKLSGR